MQSLHGIVGIRRREPVAGCEPSVERSRRMTGRLQLAQRDAHRGAREAVVR